jgi:carbonic anhydrase
MKLSKGLIIGQGVFMAALAAVLVTQLRAKHPPAPAPAPAAHVEPADDAGAEGKKAGSEHASAGHEEKGHEGKAHASKGAETKGHGDKEHDGDPSSAARDLGTDPKAIARELLAGNGRFASGEQTKYDLTAQRKHAEDGQHPSAMVLGCADSRVPPELIFDRGVGELFVVRSAGNIADPVAAGSLEYAAEHLHTKVIVILGHDECGAVKASLAGGKLPSDNLEAMVNYIAPGLKGLKGWADGPELIRLGVEANVRRQGEELLRRSSILRKAVAKDEIMILKAVYDIHTGRVRPL